MELGIILILGVIGWYLVLCGEELRGIKIELRKFREEIKNENIKDRQNDC